MQIGDEAETFPVRPGDWLVSDGERVAQVKRVYRDEGQVLVDLFLYDHNGKRVGRVSPAFNGPRTFEPACSLDGWQRIRKPEFPIGPKGLPSEDGSRLVFKLWAGERLPFIKWRPPQRKVKTASSDYNPELEKHGRIMAAQILRDVARNHDSPQQLIVEAERLENEAAGIR
jgi:hypothetical protein